MKLAKYLKERRKVAELTQSSVAVHLGLRSSQFICNVERGECLPPRYMVLPWCEFIGADPNHAVNILIEMYEDKVTREVFAELV